MKKFFEDAAIVAKSVFTWIFTLMVFGSFILNFWFAGIIYAEQDVMKENDDYLKYRDSIQLELMDRITDKNNTIRK